MSARWQEPARRHHGPIKPMAEDLPSNGTIVRAVLMAAAVIAFTWFGIPALAEWTVAVTPVDALAELPLSQ